MKLKENFGVQIMSYDIRLISLDPHLKNKLGIDEINIELIYREGKNAIVFMYEEEKIKVPDDMRYLIPFGNPPAYIFGYTISKGHAFASLFQSFDNASHLLIRYNSDLIHPIYYFTQMFDNLRTILDKNEFLTDLHLRIKDYDLDILKKIKSLDSILYTLFAHKPMVVVGQIETSIKFIGALISLIPDDVQKYYGISINIVGSYHKNTLFYIFEDIEEFDFAEQINSLLLKECNFISLETEQIFTSYSSSFTKKIADDIKNNRDKISIKKQIDKFYEEIKKNIFITDLSELADLMQIEFSDADLVRELQPIIRSIEY